MEDPTRARGRGVVVLCAAIAAWMLLLLMSNGAEEPESNRSSVVDRGESPQLVAPVDREGREQVSSSAPREGNRRAQDGRIAGRLLWMPEQRPVSYRDVEIVPLSAPGDSRNVQTDSAGRFAFVADELGWKYGSLATIRVRSGRTELGRGVVPLGSEMTVLLRSPLSSHLSGVVRRADGAPVAEAGVVVFAVVGSNHRRLTAVKTDQAGAFSFPDPESDASAYDLMIGVDGGTVVRRIRREGLAPHGDGVVIVRPQPLSLRVVERDGTPVADVGVRAASAGWSGAKWVGARTDRSGRATLALECGPVEVIVAAEGDRLAVHHERFELSPGEPLRTVRLEPASGLPTLEGVVVTPDGSGVAGAYVTAFPCTDVDDLGVPAARSDTTDERGRFTVRPLGRMAHDLTASLPPNGGWARAFGVEPGASDVRILMTETPGSIVLRIDGIDPSAPAFPGDVRACAVHESGSLSKEVAIDRWPLVLNEVPEGRCTMFVLHTGGAFAGVAEVDVRGRRQEVGVTAQPVFVHEARVLDRDGDPVAGAEVCLVDERVHDSAAPTWWREVTDRQGRFRLRTHEASPTVRVRAGASPEDFRLRPGCETIALSRSVR